MMRPFFVGPMVGPPPRNMVDAKSVQDTNQASFELLQLYPNPLRDRAEIIYNISEDANITLTISDMQGRVIRQLVSGMQEAGLYTQQWDGRDNSGRLVPAGMYTVTMQSSDKVQSRRMVITD